MDLQHKMILEGYIADMDEESRRTGCRVNALQVAINITGKKPKSTDWLLVTRDSVNEELRAVESDPGAFSRGTFFELAENIAKTLSEMQWNILYSAGGPRFITSDRPVVIRDKTERRAFPGIKDQSTEVLFPLSRNAFLQMEHTNSCQLLPRKRMLRRQSRFIRIVEPFVMATQASEEKVRSFNFAIARQSYLWIFSGVDQAWLVQELQTTSSIPKRTRTNLVSTITDLNSRRQLVRTKKEFVVVTDE